LLDARNAPCLVLPLLEQKLGGRLARLHVLLTKVVAKVEAVVSRRAHGVKSAT
jgi:hypothetical protein